MFAREVPALFRSLLASSLMLCLVLANVALIAQLTNPSDEQTLIFPVILGIASILLFAEIALLFPVPWKPLNLTWDSRSLLVLPTQLDLVYRRGIRGLVLLMTLLAGALLGTSLSWGILLAFAGLSVAMILATQPFRFEVISVSEVASDIVAPVLQPASRDMPLLSYEATLHLTRRHRQDEEGSRDELEALCKVTLEPGEDQRIIHLPIHPAFSMRPEVDVEIVDGDEAGVFRVHVTDVKTYGVRIDLKRSGPTTQPIAINVAVLIYSPLPYTAGAA